MPRHTYRSLPDALIPPPLPGDPVRPLFDLPEILRLLRVYLETDPPPNAVIGLKEFNLLHDLRTALARYDA